MEKEKAQESFGLGSWATLLRGYPVEARGALLEQELPQAASLIERHRLWWQQAAPIERLIALELILLDQPDLDPLGASARELQQWVDQLVGVEEFYAGHGGLIGYQALLLDLLSATQEASPAQFFHPPLISLETQTAEIWHAIRSGLEALPLCAELYPAGGAGDRLGLTDPQTGAPIPVALLPFDGSTLLEGMVDDCWAREWLYFRIFGQQVHCPIAMMSSAERDHHQQLVAFCESRNWFGRGGSSFRLFSQPLVPCITPEGRWVVDEGRIALKPGGHGVIWKLMQDSGVIDWLFSHHASLLIVRQVNNPLGGSDRNLLALVGIGLEQQKAMGFMSCPRLVGAAEGMNVVRTHLQPDGPRVALTNVEYTDFQKLGWVDAPSEPGSLYSAFPSNTNILFVNLQKALQHQPELPIPGLVINFKSALIPGSSEKRVVGRLESTMQNLADSFSSSLSSADPAFQELHTFCLHNRRGDTLSAAKKRWREGEALLETPQGAYLDLIERRLRVLEAAGWSVPHRNPGSTEPCCLLYWHPALGPLDVIVQQRLRDGALASGAELQLDVAEAICHQLEVQGSLVVVAKQPFGPLVDGKVQMSAACGQLVLHNVRVQNRGVLLSHVDGNFSGQPERLESCRIVLKGASKFSAEDVTLQGDHLIEVEDGEWVEALSDGAGGIQFRRHPWSEPTWACSLQWEGLIPRLEAVSSVQETGMQARA